MKDELWDELSDAEGVSYGRRRIPQFVPQIRRARGDAKKRRKERNAHLRFQQLADAILQLPIVPNSIGRDDEDRGTATRLGEVDRRPDLWGVRDAVRLEVEVAKRACEGQRILVRGVRRSAYKGRPLAAHIFVVLPRVRYCEVLLRRERRPRDREDVRARRLVEGQRIVDEVHFAKAGARRGWAESAHPAELCECFRRVVVAEVDRRGNAPVPFQRNLCCHRRRRCKAAPAEDRGRVADVRDVQP